MFIKKAGDGNYYVCRIPHGSSNRGGKRESKVYRNWWLVKDNGVTLGPTSFPTEFKGKKVRFKVELVKE